MSMIQKIEIDGKQVPFKVSAAIPRIYRIKFHRDIYKDLDALGKAVGNGDEGSSHLDMFSLEMFENITYIMAKHADPTIPGSHVALHNLPDTSSGLLWSWIRPASHHHGTDARKVLLFYYL